METKKPTLSDLENVIPYKWRVQSFSKFYPTAQCVAYIDARDVMNLLDTVVGKENWQDDYKVVNNELFAGIGIFIGGNWIWKWDVGTESQTEKEKGLVSDSFKRAAVKWGVGRFLYTLGIKKVKTNGKKGESDSADKTTLKYPQVIDNQGKIVYDISTHVNGI